MSAELQTVHARSAPFFREREEGWGEERLPVTERLARFCAELDFGAIPRDVVDKTKLCLLDSVGTMLAAATTPLGMNALRAAACFETQPVASVLGTSLRVSPPVAALVNGTFSEIFELQDGWRFGNDHPCVVIPAALAVAQWKGASGKSLLEAIVAGYEVTNRLAFAVHPRHLAAGFLPTGTAGTCGSAATASRLMGFDERRTADALGVAGFILPISTAENLWCGYTAKPLHSGYAAKLGVEAALLAEQGFAGCPIEGTPRRGRGFLEITTGDVRFERIVDRLGEHYTVRDVYFKAYPACRHAHGTAEAALRIVRERALAPRDIEHIDVYTYTLSASLLDRYTDRDSSMIAAQFSIPYVAAAAIVDRSLSTRQFTAARIHDAVILDLARRVRVHADAEIDARYPEVTPTRIEIRLRNGDVLRSQIDMPKGDPRTPMSERELIEKFEHLAGLALDREFVARVRDEVMRVDDINDLAPLFELMTRGEAR
ncbi:MAG TPA: MmgE/PrpD family protein [Casimicrobiaceae bacterium]|nr:MmgE/PrpD family protein [Casimicrobiaceae bacterium]